MSKTNISNVYKNSSKTSGSQNLLLFFPKIDYLLVEFGFGFGK